MKLLFRTAPIALAVSLSGCAGLLGGGKTPTTLVTLTPEIGAPARMTRTATAGQAVTIMPPVVSRELHSVRVPVQVSQVDVQYVADLTLTDTPDRLFAELVAETVRRTTNRIVLDSRQTTLDPGVIVSGELHRFGYDTATGQVIVEYDGSMASGGGAQVQTRRFSASVPADGTAATVGPALNRAANQVAQQVAQWIG